MAAPKGESLLADAIKTGNFAAAYALHGDDDFRKEDALRQLLDSATDSATRDFNVDLLRGGEADAQSLETALSALPMLAARRLVILRDPEALRKQALARLESYLEKPSSETLLVMIFPADSDVPAKLRRNVTLVPLDHLEGERLLKWIVRQAKIAHETEITREAAELLQQAVGNDLMELDGELDKLCSFTEGKRIDIEAVSGVVGVRPGETIVSLLQAVATRDIRQALQVIPTVLRQPKVTGVNVVMSLASQMLGIGWCRARRDAGASPSVLNRDGFAVAKKVYGFMDPRAPSERLSAWIRASGEWTAADVDAALDALLAADVALKQTRVASEEQIVSTAVLAACAGSSRAPAAA